jgi:hypothetical protein
MLLIESGCGTASVPGMVLSKKHKQKSPIEIREMQTRLYDTTDTKMLMKAMLNVLQDDNFIIKQVNVEMGLFNATKETDVESGGERFWQTFWWGKAYATYRKNSIVDCTSNVSEFGDRMRVRANFQVKIMDNKGGCVLVQEIDDPEYYQKFFAKVDKGIFIESTLYTSDSSSTGKMPNSSGENSSGEMVSTDENISSQMLKKGAKLSGLKCSQCGYVGGSNTQWHMIDGKLWCLDCYNKPKTKTCKNCDQQIGNLENAYTFNNNIVCRMCNEKLTRQAIATK